VRSRVFPECLHTHRKKTSNFQITVRQGRESEFAEPLSSHSVRIGDRQLGDTAMLIILERQIIGCF